MEDNQGFVISFHCDQNRHPYGGLTSKDRALRTVKPYIPGEIASALATLHGKEDFDKMLRRISLEAAIANHDKEVLEFVRGKVAKGEPIFLDLTEEDIERHNDSPFTRSHFVIVSILVTNTTFTLVNPQLFSEEEQELIVSVVEMSQDGFLKHEPFEAEPQGLCLSNCDSGWEDDEPDRGVSEEDDKESEPFLGSFPFARIVR